MGYKLLSLLHTVLLLMQDVLVVLTLMPGCKIGFLIPIPRHRSMTLLVQLVQMRYGIDQQLLLVLHSWING